MRNFEDITADELNTGDMLLDVDDPAQLWKVLDIEIDPGSAGRFITSQNDTTGETIRQLLDSSDYLTRITFEG